MTDQTIQSLPTSLNCTQSTLTTDDYESSADEEEEEEEEEEKDITEQKPVDFVRLLPPEVVLLMLEYLSINDLFACLDVSPEWKYQIGNYPSVWRDVTIGDEDYTLIDKLPSIGQHVKSYTIYQACQEILDGSARMLVSGYMDNLTSLAWDCSDFLSTDVLMVISHLKSTLKRLELSTTEHPRYLLPFDLPSLPSIIAACPGLEELNVSLPTSEISETTPPSVLPNPTKLTRLNWSCGTTVDIEQVYEIFAACPDLVCFKVRYCEFNDLVKIREKCPKHLRVLGFNDENITAGIDWEIPNDEELGLYELTSTCYNNTSWETFHQVLLKDQNTLNYLSLFCPPTRDPSLLFSTFQGQYLRISEGHVGWRYCATIRVDAIVMDHPLVVSYEFSRNYVDRSFPWLIDALKTDRIRTKKIEFNRCGNIGPHLLSLLDFPDLEELHFVDCQMDAKIDEFIPRLGPSITRIALRNMLRLKDSTVALLAQVPNLKQVTLSSCDFLSDKGVRLLVDSSPGLKKLEIQACKNISQDAVDHIKQTLDQRAG